MSTFTALRSNKDFQSKHLLHYHQKSERNSPRRKSLNQTHYALAERLSFFFSDVNLNHDTYARSILEQYEDKYLPLDTLMTFKTIRRLTLNPNVVLDAMDVIKDERKLEVQVYHSQSDGDVILIGRTTPFNFNESLKRSTRKIIFVEGWPVEENTRWIESRLRSLLCHDGNLDRGCDWHERSDGIVYWGKEIPTGVITIEFDTESTAEKAWENLHHYVNNSSSEKDWGGSNEKIFYDHTSSDSGIQNLTMKQVEKELTLEIGGLNLLVRSMFIPKIEPETNSIPDISTHTIKAEREMSDISLSSISDSVNVGLKNDMSDRLRKDDAIALDTSENQSKSAETTFFESELLRYQSDQKWWADEGITLSLKQYIQAMNEIHQDHITLPRPTREWLHEYSYSKAKGRKLKNVSNIACSDEHERRLTLFREVANLVASVKSSIDRGAIRALGARDCRHLSEFFSRAMLIYSESPPKVMVPLSMASTSNNRVDERDDMSGSPCLSPYEACLDALNILHKLNLDIHPSHYSFVVRAACHESRWAEAARIFLGQIEGIGSNTLIINSAIKDNDHATTGGFVPIDPTLGWDQPLEIGLYAVARDAFHRARNMEENNDAEISPSKEVFDAAMKICMISPSCQENYVLAAGIALGRAGLWSECLDFATDPSHLSSFGPSIKAAAMLSCIESSRYAEAVDVYHYFMSENQDIANEWQWAGGRLSASKPLCRDLALSAMGEISTGGYSRDALRIFSDILDDKIPFSRNALLGLMHCLECDGDWESSVKLMDSSWDSFGCHGDPKWLIVNDMIRFNGEYPHDSFVLTKVEKEDLLSELLCSTMHACNKGGHFGLSMLLCSVISSKIDETDFQNELIWSDDLATVKAFLTQKLLLLKPDVRDAFSTSLYRMGLGHLAHKISEGTSDTTITSSYVTINIPPTAESWLNAFAASRQVLTAQYMFQMRRNSPNRESVLLFERGVAVAMNYCIDSKQPTAAIFLFNHTLDTLLPQRDISFGERVKSLFNVESSHDSFSYHRLFGNSEVFDFERWRLCDSVLAAVIKAYENTGQIEKVRGAFQLCSVKFDGQASSHSMTQSLNATLNALSENDVNETISFFESLAEESTRPSTFLTLAKCLARNHMWAEIGEIYNKARHLGCISEELGFIALQAISEAELLQGKISVMRKIVDDVSNLVGMDSKEWISSQYWNIKKYAGFHYARLLMNWNHPETSQREEILFAVAEMRENVRQGILSKNIQLLCIVKLGALYTSEGGCEDSLDASESQRLSAINIILEACVEANRSGLLKKHTFTAEVSRSLRALKGDRECIKFAIALISSGKKCRHKTALEHAISAASELRDYESLEILTTAYENAGFNS